MIKNDITKFKKDYPIVRISNVNVADVGEMAFDRSKAQRKKGGSTSNQYHSSISPSMYSQIPIAKKGLTES
jgi:hypothetical protein